MTENGKTFGWASTFQDFCNAASQVIRRALHKFIGEASPAQVKAWDDSIPQLQDSTVEAIGLETELKRSTSILEYQLPLELRRPDGVMLVGGSILVLELKGREKARQADIDQVAAYARDLKAYHRECHNRNVYPILIPTLAGPNPTERNGVTIVGPEGLSAILANLFNPSELIAPASFLDPEAYCPLPSLITAARELFLKGDVREIWHARAATDPAVECIARIARSAAETKTRKLILVTGVPGAGKTLVGLRSVHAGYLDAISVDRGKEQGPPALFLSGNGPLCEVLQYELKKAGGNGRTFVRHIKQYLNHYVPKVNAIPSEHLLVFDEAQRAFSQEKVANIHKNWSEEILASEPELFVRLCQRMPEWSVMVGLVGGGQEIHLGEEEGVVQWKNAIDAVAANGDWTVHVPPELESIFQGGLFDLEVDSSLNLDTELRFHLAKDIHNFVVAFLEKGDAYSARLISENLWQPNDCPQDGIRLWATRDLDQAKSYLRARYEEDPAARFGVLASAKDKSLVSHGVDNSWQGTGRVSLGRWYCEGEENPKSCRHLEQVVTEFGAQGLELDMSLIAWGSDLIRNNGRWSNDASRGYRPPPGVQLRDAFQLRINAYRVLLTRGRDGMVIFVPPTQQMDETWEFLLACGFRQLPVD